MNKIFSPIGPLTLFLAVLVGCQPSPEGGGESPSSSIPFDSLHYDEPGTRFVEGLPLGNGQLGANILGRPEHDGIFLNHDTLYAGEPSNTSDGFAADIQKTYDEVVDLLSEEKYMEAEALIDRSWLGRKMQPYQPMGRLWLEFPGHQDYSDYHRALDLRDAVARVRYEHNGVRYTREYFCSYPDQVLVIRLTADQDGALNFRARFSSPHPITLEKIGPTETTMHGQVPGFVLQRTLDFVEGLGPTEMNKYPEIFTNDGQRKFNKRVLYGDEVDGLGTFFEGRLHCRLEGGGEASVEDGVLRVTGAQTVVLLVSGATSFNGFDVSPSRDGRDPAEQNQATLKAVQETGYAELMERHLEDVRQFYDRVSFTLPVTSQSEWTTDERIRKYNDGGDEALSVLLFNYGRYLMIAGSRPGTQPLNLQGIWSQSVDPPWGSAYTTNINLEMNYWPAEVCQLPEMHEPLIRLVRELSVNGEKIARDVYGRKGWVANHNTHIWRRAQSIDRSARFAVWPVSAPWLCQHIWEHYQFNRDEAFLRENLPVMQGAAKFLLDWMVENEDGYLLTPVSTSPENDFVYGEGKRAAVSPGCTMDMAMIRDLFGNCLAASEILGESSPITDEIRSALPKLLPYQIGQFGQLQEWYRDWDRKEDKHRHVSHLFAVHPGNSITAEDEDLFQAARQSLEYRGDMATGWSLAWKINFWARFYDGDRARRLIGNLLSPARDEGDIAGVYPNLWDAHPPFQIDGNFGATAGIAEMLLQSQNDEIHLLPALPSVWPSGSIQGLKARGGWIIDMTWKEGVPSQVTVHSLHGGKTRVRYGEKAVEIDLKPGARKNLSGTW